MVKQDSLSSVVSTSQSNISLAALISRLKKLSGLRYNQESMPFIWQSYQQLMHLSQSLTLFKVGGIFILKIHCSFWEALSELS